MSGDISYKVIGSHTRLLDVIQGYWISYKVISFLFLMPVDLVKGGEIPVVQKAEIATTFVSSSNMKQSSFVLF